MGLVRNDTFTPYNKAPWGLKHGLLNCGILPGMVVPFMKSTGTSGQGQIGFYYSQDKTGDTWAGGQYTPTDLVSSNTERFSACIDANDGLHFVWLGADLSVRYAYWARSGSSGPTPWGTSNTPTYTKVLYTGGSSNLVAGVFDIDTYGTGAHLYTVVGVTYSDSTSSPNTYTYRAYVINDSTQAVASTTRLLASQLAASGSPDIALTCMKNVNGSSPATVAFAVAITFTLASGDQNDVFDTWTYTVSGSVFTAGPTKRIPNSGKGGTKRKQFMFCPDGSNIIYWMCVGSTNYWAVQKYQFVNSTTLSTLSAYSINEANHSGAFVGSLTPYGYTVLVGNGADIPDRLVFSGAGTSGNPYVMAIAEIDASQNTTWRSSAYAVGPNNSSGAKAGTVLGGSNRQPHSNMVLAVWWNQTAASGNNYPISTVRTTVAQASAVTRKPSATSAGLTQTAYPTFEASYKLQDFFGASALVRMEFQVAADSGFTDIRADYLTTTFVNPQNTDSVNNADVRSSIQATVAITSGYWYARARVVDMFGNVSPWSAGYQFRIQHQPTPSNLSPDNNKLLGYVGNGASSNAFFSWDFSDPYASDYITAYQIAVTRDSDGAAVVNTGKVAASNNQGVAAIPSAFKDTVLDWILTVWDSDDVASNPVGPGQFRISSPPVPAIVSPANGGIATSGTPIVQWNNGIAGTKQLQNYRLQITKGSTTVYDSGTVASTTATSISIPPGLLRNNNAYSMRLTITDNAGQTGIATSTFTTSYSPPAGVDTTQVFLYEFDRKGFIYLGWDWSSLDPDFISWNIYRQEVGGDIVPLGTFTELRPVYGFRDYSAKANTHYQYWITQTVNRTGDLVESNATTVIDVNTPGQSYWLLDSLGIVDPVPLFGVSGDTWTDEHEESVMTVLGRGRHVDIGETLGANGSLTVQIKDKFINLQAATNYLPNPALQISSDGINPDSWTFSFANATNGATRYDTFNEPAPTGKFNVFLLSVDSFNDTTGNSFFACNCTSDVDLRKTPITPGADQMHLSVWAARPASQTWGLNANVRIIYYAADHTTQVGATQYVGMGIIDTYEPVGIDSPVGRWKRYGAASAVVPAGAVYANFYYYFPSTSGQVQADNPMLYVGGFMMTRGNVAKPYIDGDMQGVSWDTAPGSSSTTTGYFTAHQQRLAIENMKELGRPLWLRSPFGDVLLVSIGDESNERIAGVGPNDYDTMSLPYREIAF